ncbi:uncharacterized protein VTP21DRAFT_4685 [Calcarisporiella thermophila]|uniref:uncharacterized protein n=1 Tax=Calcarisporiella thermophila TaxID=911321 RepID=UPI00374261AA
MTSKKQRYDDREYSNTVSTQPLGAGGQSMITVAMRVRKAVAEGYKLPKTSNPATTMKSSERAINGQTVLTSYFRESAVNKRARDEE